MTLALLITAATGAWAEDTYTVQFKANGKTVTRDVTLPHTFRCKFDYANGELDGIIMELYGWTGDDGINYYCISSSTPQSTDPNKVKAGNTNSNHYITIDSKFDGTVTVSGMYSTDFGQATYSLDISCFVPAGTFSINDAKTEATMEMPQYDVTATYTLKRDLSVETQVTVGDDHSAQPRYRVQKQGDTFQPYGMTTADVMALFHVHDQIENEDLTAVQDYTVQIYAVDIEGQPTGEAITFQNFTYAPGQYIVKAQGQGNYVGQTTESNVFTLYQGYPVEIAAQSFATYYSDDEALTLEESFAETAGLYTVASVTATEAVLSEKIDVMPKRTPMLIYNESETAQQILLIPTADVAPLTDVADEFKGTAVEKEVTAAEVAATNFYVLTDQNQFVWVKDAGTIAAHRCWLEIAPSQAAGARRIVFSGSGTTGISTTDYTDYTDGTFYDLNGRKFIKKPTKKGIYIQNGKKVVVK